MTTALPPPSPETVQEILRLSKAYNDGEIAKRMGMSRVRVTNARLIALSDTGKLARARFSTKPYKPDKLWTEQQIHEAYGGRRYR